MNPPRNFPSGILKLEEYENGELTTVHAELKSTTQNRATLQRMRNDLLMVNPKLDLQIRENNA